MTTDDDEDGKPVLTKSKDAKSKSKDVKESDKKKTKVKEGSSNNILRGSSTSSARLSPNCVR